jgi:hypothetical protein
MEEIKDNKPEENKGFNIPFIDPTKLKESTCDTCRGTGKLFKLKCPDCGGSGNKEKINVMQDFVQIDKGVPQRKYEVTITDTEKKKVIYKNTGFGGVLSMMERIDKFNASEIVGGYQSAMWGNPLVQRFAIDRLEEQFAKSIEAYLDAMEQAGMYFSNREQMRKILIEGNLIKFRNLINSRGMSDKNENTLDKITDASPITANPEMIERIKRILNDNGIFTIIAIERIPDDSTGTKVEVIAKGMQLKQIVMSVMEFAVAAFANEKGQNSISNLQKMEMLMNLLKEIAKEVADNADKLTKPPII